MLPTPSDPVATFVFFILVFCIVGAFFLFIHLLMGSFIRPSMPDDEKLTVYECGEPTVGSAWIQFDVRFYVVALLFVIFDVEVAFFFPWAVVFGKANELASIPDVSTEERALLKKDVSELSSGEKSQRAQIESNEKARAQLSAQLLPTGVSKKTKKNFKLATYEINIDKRKATETETVTPITAADASSWAKIAFLDIMVFFSVLLVGFVYLWRRGDIDWVRAYHHHHEPPVEPEKPLEQHKISA